MEILWIVEKIMTMGSKFEVYDSNGYHKYYVEGEKRSLGEALTIYSSNKKEKLGIIKKDKKCNRYCYKLYDDNNILISDIKKIEKSLDYEANGTNGEYKVVETNKIERAYKIYRNKEEVGTVCKHFSLSEDSYKLEFLKGADEFFLISLIIVMDMVRFYVEHWWGGFDSPLFFWIYG